MDKNEVVKISKDISRALRHRPEEYGLEIDPYGYTNIDDLIKALNERHQDVAPLSRDDIVYLTTHIDKRRFEINGDKIRALYGHSLKNVIIKKKDVPPAVLYHGTSSKNKASIEQKGLLPMSRQYVHLSIDKKTAYQVGWRHGKDVVIYVIDAKKAYADGIQFYIGNEQTWLSDSMPAKYLTINEEE